MKRIFKIIFIITLFILVSCGHKSRLMYEPSTIYAGTARNVSTNNIRGAILSSLNLYDWLVESDYQGVIIAKQTRKNHVARVKISYTKNSVSINYLDSQNLNYRRDKHGQARIHATYNRWLTNLEKAIANNVRSLG